MRHKAIVIIQILILSVSISAAPDQEPAVPKAEDCVKVQWSSVRYDKSVVVGNAKAKLDQPRDSTSERLTLTCEVEIRDPNRVLATSDQGAITQLTDSKGRDVNVRLAQSPRRLRYTGPRYRQRFVPPAPVPKWKSFIQSLLRIQPAARARPQRVTELQPSNLNLELDMAVLQEAGGEIRRVKGYLYALTAGSIVHVDVPFEPNDNWVRLTEDQEIRVLEAQNTGSSYRFRIEARPQGRMSPFDLSAGNPLPDRIVIERQLIGPDGKPTHTPGGFLMFPAPISGSGSGSGGNAAVTKIRFRIAIDPDHAEIPFEFEHVPLPEP
ncbi:MAG: hypothetical protein JW993_03790 [Sedimentisphaerales bacterium]|nr:hypothetical protein [Sedimentisphaerales bacterium]